MPQRLIGAAGHPSILLALALVACGNEAPAATDGPASSAAAPPPSVPEFVDLSAIACGTADPDDVGELTGTWSGSDGGTYSIRQVGDCIWWFGTEIADARTDGSGQRGFANVAGGRVDGRWVTVEYADLPMGDVIGGGGLTFTYDEATDQLRLTAQRGDWQPFGGRILTRIHPEASPGS